MGNSTWWLSFALKEGKTSYVVIVDAPSFEEAHQKACRLGLNPGGEVLGFPIPTGFPEHSLPRDRFLTPEELAEVGSQRLGDVDGSN